MTGIKFSYWLFFYLGFFFASSKIFAYPNYISLGYQSCMSCHFNPYGNGPLTDYGRAVGATAISDRLLWKKKTKEEKIAEKSGFGFSPPKRDWLRPSLSVRAMYLSRNVGEEQVKDRFIPMDISGAIALKFLERDKLTAVGHLAYAPKPKAMEKTDMEIYRSREHYVGYRFSKEWGLYAGLMDKVFGIRVPDHTAYSRAVTALTQNDQTHGVIVHYVNEHFELGVQPFVGNLVQKASLRQAGVTSQLEVSVGEHARLGGSALYSSSEYVEMVMAAAHGRIGLGKGNSILAEVGQVTRTLAASKASTSALYVFTQSHYMLRRGLFPLLSLEYLKPDSAKEAYNYRLGPGVQFFPFQRLELRGDACQETRVPVEGKTTSSWDLTAQIHLWF